MWVVSMQLLYTCAIERRRGSHTKECDVQQNHYQDWLEHVSYFCLTKGWSPPDKNPMDLLIVASWAGP